MMTNKQPLRILFSHYGYKNGGGFSRSYMLAKELAQLGNKVTFLTSQKNGFIFPFKAEVQDGLELISFPDIVPLDIREKGFGILTPVLKTFYILFKKYDILHSDSGHRPNAGLPCIIHRVIYKTVYITEWWDFFGKGGQYDLRPLLGKYTIGIWDRLTEVPSKRKSDGVVALSRLTKERAIKNKIPEERVTIIHGGCDVAKIKCLPDNKDLKSQYRINSNTLIFGFLGMMKNEFYDIIPFIEAISHLKKNYNVKWFTTGIMINQQLKNKYSIGDELLEFGWLDYDKYCEVIALADVYVLLSRDNQQNMARWPNKIGDYLASGRLVLANPIGDLAEIMYSYPNSFVSTKWNSQDVENAVSHLFDIKDTLLEKGFKNRLLAENDFSWQQRSMELQNFYYYILQLNYSIKNKL